MVSHPFASGSHKTHKDPRQSVGLCGGKVRLRASEFTLACLRARHAVAAAERDGTAVEEPGVPAVAAEQDVPVVVELGALVAAAELDVPAAAAEQGATLVAAGQDATVVVEQGALAAAAELGALVAAGQDATAAAGKDVPAVAVGQDATAVVGKDVPAAAGQDATAAAGQRVIEALPVVEPAVPKKESDFAVPAAWRLPRSAGVRHWPWQTKSSRSWPPRRVAPGRWSEPCACRVRLTAQKAGRCAECHGDRRYRRRGCCWRWCYSPLSSGHYRWSGFCSHRRA